MDEDKPLAITNAEFVGYEEEDIDQVTEAEHRKLQNSPVLPGLEAKIEEESGPGHWEEHWVTVDTSGTRVFADVFYGDRHVTAVTAAGDMVRDFTY